MASVFVARPAFAVTVARPGFPATRRPPGATDTTAGALELHTTSSCLRSPSAEKGSPFTVTDCPAYSRVTAGSIAMRLAGRGRIVTRAKAVVGLPPALGATSALT